MSNQAKNQVVTVSDMFDKAPNVDDLPEGEFKSNVLEIEEALNQGLHLLRTFANPVIAPLADLFWKLLEHKIVLVSASTDLDGISFIGFNRQEGFQQAMILIPSNWLDLLKEDEIYQAGCLVGAASKSMDFYNGLMQAGKESEFNERAFAYEAEFLFAFKHIFPDHPFNDTQKAIMATYPDGVESARVRHLIYKSKPFFVAEA